MTVDSLEDFHSVEVFHINAMYEKSGTISCFDIADYFLSLISEEFGDYMSNLRLQKLVYLSQGFHLAHTGKPLFAEEIEMWVVGPVLPFLYHKYAAYGTAPLPENKKQEKEQVLSVDILDLLDKVYQRYGQFAGWKLRQIIRQQSIFDAVMDSETMLYSHKQMEDYFSAHLSLGYDN